MSLGVFHVAGTPTVTLSNSPLSDVEDEYNKDGLYDVAWDAVAFQPLAAKPNDFVVSMGDSYSSGEGATTSTSTGVSYSSESDHDGNLPSMRGACHRSNLAWSRKATLPRSGSSVGSREAQLDPTLDYHMVACSGAETKHVLSGADHRGQNGELPQLAQGYLDVNTTLVTISIGGNDMRFGPVLQQCVLALVVCQDSTMGKDSTRLGDAEQDLVQNKLSPRVAQVLTAIKAQAPNAKILLMGYPRLFDDGGDCIPGLSGTEWPWINELSDQVRDKLSATAANAASSGISVKFVDPQPNFAGRTVCSNTNAIQQLVLDQTPGDKAMFSIPVPGKDTPVGVSQQSIHPNPDGTTLYAAAMNGALAGFY